MTRLCCHREVAKSSADIASITPTLLLLISIASSVSAYERDHDLVYDALCFLRYADIVGTAATEIPIVAAMLSLMNDFLINL